MVFFWQKLFLFQKLTNGIIDQNYNYTVYYCIVLYQTAYPIWNIYYSLNSIGPILYYILNYVDNTQQICLLWTKMMVFL